MRQFRAIFPTLFLCPATVLLLAACVLGGATSLRTRNERATVVRLPEVCGVVPAELRVSGELPRDVEGALRQKNRSVVQRAADVFSWREFLALNWPARRGLRGGADLHRPIGAPGPRVWETWKETHEVYLAGGTTPPDWNAPQPRPTGTQLPAHSGLPGEVHLLTASLQAVQADGTLPPTLTDRHGHIVRYEVRMNRIMFDFIRTNGLYNALRQAGENSISFPNGAILIKAAWREMEPGEASRFLTANAWVYDLKNGKPVHWRRRTVGLVGFHIVQKTPSAPQWIWSTFEHVANLTGPHASFYTGSGTRRAANTQTAVGVPNQVKRLTPISADAPDCNRPLLAKDNVQALNRAVQRELARQKSVLQYYELVTTQWPIPSDETPVTRPATVVQALPAVAANSTMETFAQDTSSCIGCHSTARSSRKDRFISADFTFTLNNAQPVVENTQVLPPLKQPGTPWERQNWSAIKRGRDLTEHTYEMLPQYVHAKLHCASCHLDGARNPDSAWWVGMTTKYPTLQKLQARINQCFERSMNGSPIPAGQNEANLSQDAPDMNAFITYMRWMDAQYLAKTSLPPHNGLQVLPEVSGDLHRGEANFVQKCAVCHGKEGQGRYEHNAYFRPALWGANSFNALAGLDKPAKLAAFVQANMPFGSGGSLTTEEAWDLAAFLHSRQRPLKSAGVK